MDQKTKQNLLQAKEYCYKMRLTEAYGIFRRYYDRLPFDPSPEHAEYIGMFVRILLNLGKEYELKFYLGELEKLKAKTDSPHIRYQLAVIYACLSEPRREASKELLEGILRDPSAADLHVKSKIMLADYYDSVHGDVGACRRLIDSIGVVEDPQLSLIVDLWRGKVLRDERKYVEAEALFLDVLSDVSPTENWHAYFSGKVLLATLYVMWGKREKAEEIVTEARSLLEGRRFKEVQLQLVTLERMLEQKACITGVQFLMNSGEFALRHANKTLSLKNRSNADRILILLAKKRFLKKEAIVKDVFRRNYDSSRDDSMIYYHIHSLRKKIREIGLPPEAILSEGEGYRFVPEVETVKEEL